MKHSNDIIQDRRNQILTMIKDNGSISINALDAAFDVSVLTIRRDLAYLEQRGLIDRYHGGARYKSVDTTAPYFDEKLMSHRSEKIVIAKYISSIIPENASIFMNGGTTTLEIMRQLKQQPVTVITNNVMAFSAANSGNCTIICSGGEYNSTSKTYSGPMATAIIEKTIADFCILGVNGIDSKIGVTTAIYSESLINATMAQRCNGPVIIVADSAKIGKTFCFTSLDLDTVDELVTVSTADQQHLSMIAEKGVKITLADQFFSHN